jgi:hypothetical protein
MHIEDIFEDLEAQFAAASQVQKRDSFTANAKAIEIKTSNQNPWELIAPIVGIDFVAGMDTVSPIWHFFPMRVIHRMVFHTDVEVELPNLRNFALDFSGIIQTLPTPCAIRWRVSGPDDFLRSGQLHNATANLLFAYTNSQQRPIAVPIAAIDQLSIESVDNLNGDF